MAETLTPVHKEIEMDEATPADQETSARIDEALGLKMISLRVEMRLIDDFKLIAKTKGIGYQPLMRRVLMEHAASVLADMGREYAARLTPTLPKDE
jgi:predicted DNA binding CopG/RHH family protein